MTVVQFPQPPAISGFFPFEAYCQLPTAPETWIIQDLLPAGGWLNIYGPPKEGKSFAALQLAIDIGAGHDEWLGFPIRTPGPVLYLQLDTPRSLWRQRLLDIQAATGLPFDGVHFADKESAPYPYDILNAASGSAAWLAHQVHLAQPRVVVIDTLRELHQGDEDKSQQMQQVAAALDIAIRPAACVLVSHSRKENLGLPAEDRDHVMDDNRGSGYVAGRMDAVVKINRKRLTYKGRTVDLHRLKLKRLPSHLWALDISEEEAAIQRVLRDPTLPSLMARAEALSQLTGKTIEACRSLLRRRVDGLVDATGGQIGRPPDHPA